MLPDSFSFFAFDEPPEPARIYLIERIASQYSGREGCDESQCVAEVRLYLSIVDRMQAIYDRHVQGDDHNVLLADLAAVQADCRHWETEEMGLGTSKMVCGVEVKHSAWGTGCHICKRFVVNEDRTKRFNEKEEGAT